MTLREIRRRWFVMAKEARRAGYDPIKELHSPLSIKYPKVERRYKAKRNKWIVLAHDEGATHAQIGAICGLTRGTVGHRYLMETARRKKRMIGLIETFCDLVQERDQVVKRLAEAA